MGRLRVRDQARPQRGERDPLTKFNFTRTQERRDDCPEFFTERFFVQDDKRVMIVSVEPVLHLSKGVHERVQIGIPCEREECRVRQPRFRAYHRLILRTVCRGKAGEVRKSPYPSGQGQTTDSQTVGRGVTYSLPNLALLKRNRRARMRSEAKRRATIRARLDRIMANDGEDFGPSLR